MPKIPMTLEEILNDAVGRSDLAWDDLKALAERWIGEGTYDLDDIQLAILNAWEGYQLAKGTYPWPTAEQDANLPLNQ